MPWCFEAEDRLLIHKNGPDGWSRPPSGPDRATESAGAQLERFYSPPCEVLNRSPLPSLGQSERQ